MTIADLERVLKEAKAATKDIKLMEMFFRVAKPLTNFGVGSDDEVELGCLQGKININNERRILKKHCDKTDYGRCRVMKEHVGKYHTDEEPLVFCPGCKVWVKKLWIPFNVNPDLDTPKCMLCIETASRK